MAKDNDISPALTEFMRGAQHGRSEGICEFAGWLVVAIDAGLNGSQIRAAVDREASRRYPVRWTEEKERRGL